MPNFAFLCDNCGTKFDEILPISQSSEIVPCPICKTVEHVRKDYMHPIPIKFNARGFSTTYRG